MRYKVGQYVYSKFRGTKYRVLEVHEDYYIIVRVPKRNAIGVVMVSDGELK
jgi:hypothetical protein